MMYLLVLCTYTIFPSSETSNCLEELDTSTSSSSIRTKRTLTEFIEFDNCYSSDVEESVAEAEPVEKKKKNHVNEMLIETLKNFNTALQAEKTKDSFGQTVAEILETLPDSVKVKAKLNILKYLTKLQEKGYEECENVDSEFFIKGNIS